MLEELLSEIGLSGSEIAVYIALIDIGSSTTGPIIKKAGIASGKAYLILDKLMSKGLVTYVIKSGVKNYQAKDPERLLDYLKEKEADLKKKESRLAEAIVLLKQKYEQKKHFNIAEIYEGMKGFRTFYESIIKEARRGDTIYIMGVPMESFAKFNTYFISWNMKRIKSGISMKILYNHNCRELGRQREKLKLTEVRYMKKELETPSWTLILNDYVAMLNVREVPVCFLLRSMEASESHMKYFDVMWKQAAKP